MPSEDENTLRNNSNGPVRDGEEGNSERRSSRYRSAEWAGLRVLHSPFADRRDGNLPLNTQKRPSADTEHTEGKGVWCRVLGAWFRVWWFWYRAWSDGSGAGLGRAVSMKPSGGSDEVRGSLLHPASGNTRKEYQESKIVSI